MFAYIDFETRSRVDLRKCGASVYARDPSTDVLCMAYAIDSGPVWLWTPGDRYPFPLDSVQLIFVAHNAAFEKAIWEGVMQRRYRWPEIPLLYWRCSAARVAALSLPRKLDDVAPALGLTDVKDREGHRVMLQMTKPKKPSKKDPSEWYDNAERYEKLYNYCVQDVVVERLVCENTQQLSRFEEMVWRLDQTINSRGIPIDREAVKAGIELEARQKTRLEKKLQKLTNGEVRTAKQVGKLMSWLNRNGVNIENLQAATVQKALTEAKGEVKEVLEIRRALGRASTAKLKAMLNRADNDSRIRGNHLYHGATTGRWSGMGIQIQNFPKGWDKSDQHLAFELILAKKLESIELLFGDPMTCLSKSLRGMIKAPAGKKFIVCDFAQIEARVLAWMAGQNDLLRAFRENQDVYSDMARKLYKSQSVTSAQRALGKACVLGSGYQMGAKKFRETVAKWGIEISEGFSEETIYTYRQTYPLIPKLWYSLQQAAMECVQTKHDTGTVVGPHTVLFRINGRYLFMRLPSGRELAYVDPVVREEETPIGRRPQLSYMTLSSYTHKWERTRTYGGKLTENLIQATARDFLVEAMLKLEKAGYPVCFHVHDEVVCEVDEHFGSVQEVEALMNDLPEWGEHCPISSEGFECVRYRKE